MNIPASSDGVLRFNIPETAVAARERVRILSLQVTHLHSQIGNLKVQKDADQITADEMREKKAPLINQVSNVRRELSFLKTFIREKEETQPGACLPVLEHFKQGKYTIGRRKFKPPVSIEDAEARRIFLVSEKMKIETQLAALKGRYTNLRQMSSEESDWRGRAIAFINIISAEISALRTWKNSQLKSLDISTLNDIDVDDSKSLLRVSRHLLMKHLRWESMTPDLQDQVNKLLNAIQSHLLK